MYRIFLFLCIVFSWSNAMGQIKTIQDAQIQSYFETIVNRFGYDVGPIQVHIVNDSTINAFASGLNIFINTGLIQAAQNANVLEGVIAHEIGHIKGRHYVQVTNDLKNITSASAIAIAASTLIGLASGQADIIQAGILASTSASSRGVISAVRSNEEEADSYAIDILRENRKSPKGIIKLFERLETIEKSTIIGTVDTYQRTHPINKDRISYITSFLDQWSVASSTYEDKSLQLIQAKIAGYFDNASNMQVDKSFLQNSEAAVYYEIYQLIGQKKFQDALVKSPLLTSGEPFVDATKGEIFFAIQNYPQAIKSYLQYLKHRPNSPDVIFHLAKSYLQSENPKNYKKAVFYFSKLLLNVTYKAGALKGLSECYYNLEDDLKYKYYMMEYQNVKGNTTLSKQIAKSIMDIKSEDADLAVFQNRAKEILNLPL